MHAWPRSADRFDGSGNGYQPRARGPQRPIATVLAETGGQNAMIVESTALPEQWRAMPSPRPSTSAGQRCSALRVLFVQEDVADRMLEMILGAMDQLKIGDPMDRRPTSAR